MCLDKNHEYAWSRKRERLIKFGSDRSLTMKNNDYGINPLEGIDEQKEKSDLTERLVRLLLKRLAHGRVRAVHAITTKHATPTLLVVIIEFNGN